ncbi:MBOAT family O-acyltransferase [Butyrivibrio sp. AD3002]|uniref:MBOAT family O-acyltransferase n=1 Tax=Butyrivibrio sp. AD3002 TaxID=1280670 RepID=UPI0003B46E06|nr:MBOAT family O-acyltransferase [Butyrivibrio sp. AD3002]
MSLVSLEFFVFIAILIIAYFVCPKRYQWGVLLAGSCVFYLWGSWKIAYYIAVTIIVQYFAAIKLDDINQIMNKELSESSQSIAEKKIIKGKYAHIKNKWIVCSLLISLGLLIFTKYIDFFIDNANGILHIFNNRMVIHKLGLVIPLGISFYTFQSLGYVIDVYKDRERAERNFLKFALFVSFFPTIVQGPIERHNHLAMQLYAEHEYNYNRLCFGIQRMLWGYIKKLVIADRAFVIVNEVFKNYEVNGYYGFVIIIGALLAGIRVYADFSGGMDIVIGVCEALGIELTENFRQPYMAKSIKEFWQRWHITLGAWFKNYVFYPISMSKSFNKLGQKLRPKLGKTSKYVPPTMASLIVFLIIGIWHGANWKYIVYGFWNAFWVSSGTFLADYYAIAREKFHIRADSKNWHFFQMLRTLLLVTIGRFFSQADSVGTAFTMIKAMFSRVNLWVFTDGSLYKLGLDEKNFRFLLVAIMGMFFVDILHEKGIHIREQISGFWLPVRWAIYYAAFFFVVIFGMYGSGYNASDFVYMHF